MSLRVLLGTYANAGGAGLRTLTFQDGTWTAGDISPDVRNASFGTRSQRHDLYYFVDEQADGAVGVYRASDGGWQTIATVPTWGAEPCYVALDPKEELLAVANYGSGSAAVFRIDPQSGVPTDPPIVLADSGHGRNGDRQEGPHVHCTCFSPEGRWLYVVDLGTDQITSYEVSTDGSLGAREVAYRAPEGSGPRHLVFHPTQPLAILLSELASTLTILRVEGGTLRPVVTVSTLPPDFHGESLGGHLSLNAAGDRVYVTNRGHDSIATFGWDGGETLSLFQHLPSGGNSPRSFVLLEAERQMLVAHEQSGDVTAFDILPGGTLAGRGGGLTLPGAVFLLVAAT